MMKVYLTFSFLLAVLLVAQAHGKEKEIGFYQLKRGNLKMNLTNYGATVVSVIVPDKHGNLDDITLGYDDIEQYKNDSWYFGALIGRVANRIGHARFTLHNHTYNLPANDHGNTLHGGFTGFGDVIWTVKAHKEDSYITFTYDSQDNEEGFPGRVEVAVTYMLLGRNKYVVKMIAKPVDKPTPVNLAQHTYWNLGGQKSGDILSHEVQIFGSKITAVDNNLIPTGKLESVKGTPYDFLEPRTVGSRVNEVPGLYDINYVLDGNSSRHLQRVATVRENVSGRKLELWSNQVGVQFYTSGMLNATKGKDGAVYDRYGGIALETQGLPDSVNHPDFPSQIVHPGHTYKHYMVYRFTACC
ncbi:aldose 1-epimerase-like [Vigna unguiculata]|uniref:Aldose 1-epimerase n=1 Tax=Vigna unguiculata TaxID=3917 RepID=A0A4D6NM02_VIGUN|nr:aldose 1-epimerase-like [Vigna unguiculata]QCE13961.1 aldose 1-epimerase [Vigna unguiculata]